VEASLTKDPDVGGVAPDPSTSGPEGHNSKSCDSALAQAFTFLGKRWNGVILGTLLNGSSGFAQLKRSVSGISDSVLSERLSELQTAGLIVRSVKAGPPVSVSYDLSNTGRALIPSMHALSAWAAENFPSDTPLP
jgi:DNA-binding HxlR family transcriptional regulator